MHRTLQFSSSKIIRDVKIIFILELCYPLRMLPPVFIPCGIILANPRVPPLRNPADKTDVEKEEEEAPRKPVEYPPLVRKHLDFFSYATLIFRTFDRLHGYALAQASYYSIGRYVKSYIVRSL